MGGAGRVGRGGERKRQFVDPRERNNLLINLQVLLEQDEDRFSYRLFQLKQHRKLILLLSLAFDFTLRTLTVDLLDTLELLYLLLTARVVLVRRRTAELLFFESYHFFLSLHLHLHVLLVLFVELCFFLLITQLPHEVVEIGHLLILDLLGRSRPFFLILLAVLSQNKRTFDIVSHLHLL